MCPKFLTKYQMKISLCSEYFFKNSTRVTSVIQTEDLNSSVAAFGDGIFKEVVEYRWLMPIIIPTWESEIERIVV
jgi:hypothetical protein